MSSKPSSLYHCSRPSAVGCSLGCLLRQGVFPLIGQHAEGLPVPLCVHTPLPGGSVCALYSLAPGSWRCAEAKLPHIPHGQSPPENRKQVLPMTGLHPEWQHTICRKKKKQGFRETSQILAALPSFHNISSMSVASFSLSCLLYILRVYVGSLHYSRSQTLFTFSILTAFWASQSRIFPHRFLTWCLRCLDGKVFFSIYAGMSVVQIEHICVESWHSRSVVKSYWVESFASQTGIQLSTFRLPTKCVNPYITENHTRSFI